MDTTPSPKYPIPLGNQEPLEYFQRSLSISDRRILADLLTRVEQHRAAIQHSAHPLLYQVLLLAMIMEEQKEIAHLQRIVADRGLKRKAW